MIYDTWDNVGISGPYSEFCEKACIGGCLVQERVFKEVCRLLSPEHFYLPFHRAVFAVIKARDSMPDIESVRSGLTDLDLPSDTIEDFLLDMATEFANVVTDIGRHIEIVHEKWILRQYVALGKDCAEIGADAAKAIGNAAKIQAGSFIGGTECGLIGEFLREERKRGVSSFLRFLNDSTVTEGWAAGQMHLIIGYRGSGKSALMIQDAVSVSQIEGPVAYCTFSDLGREDIADRIIKNLSGFSHRPNNPVDCAAFNHAVSTVRGLKIHVLDATKRRGQRDIESVASDIRRLREDKGIVAFYLDYAQKIRTRNPKVRTDLDRLTEVSDVAQWLAADLNIPGIVGSQLTPGSPKLGTLDISKGGRVMEEDAATVLKIKVYRDEERVNLDPPYNTTPGACLVHIDKNRYGKSDLSQMHIFNERYARFEEL